MFVQTLISRCTCPLGLCAVCCMVYVWACRMHYGAFRKMCRAHFLLQTPKTRLLVQFNQTVTLLLVKKKGMKSYTAIAHVDKFFSNVEFKTVKKYLFSIQIIQFQGFKFVTSIQSVCYSISMI